jgi:hypothetical protein
VCVREGVQDNPTHSVCERKSERERGSAVCVCV